MPITQQAETEAGAAAARLPRSALVICTKDRAADLERCLASVAREVVRPEIILIVDAGSGDAARDVGLAANHALGCVRHLRHPPGLTAQRNAAITALAGDDVDVVHFVDDDVIVEPGYFEAILKRFGSDTDGRLGGVGPVILVQRQPVGARGLFRLLKRFFALEGPPGRVLRSGRNTVVWSTSRAREVEWLVGAGMSFRRAVFERERFDERLEGYCWGEDFDFGFRVSRAWRLLVIPEARLRHEHSPVNRATMREYARTRTVLLHRWVVENRSHGMRPVAFWWSVVGEVILATGRIVGYRDRQAARQAAGVVQGSLDILRAAIR